MSSSNPSSSPSPALYRTETYTPDESVGYLIRQVFASVQRHIDVQMQPHDLTAMQWGPLLCLSKGKGNTAAALAREACSDTGAMTRMLDRLEGKGLVRRVRSEEDRRVVHIELTPAGDEAVKQIPVGICEVLNHHLQGFSEQELDQLKSLLRRMLHNGQREAGTPEAP